MSGIPLRIVSLCPSITETLFAIGAGARVVGRTTFCVHPADELASVATIGGTKRPDLDAILALKPDLVLLNEEENRLEDAIALQERGLRVESYFPKTIEETADYVEALGRITGYSGRSAELGERLRRGGGRPIPIQQSIRMLYLIWRKPWMAVNRDTFISHLLERAGLENVFLGAERYPALSADEIRALAPDVLLLSSEPFPFKEPQREELSRACGIPGERCILVDGELLSWHGVRTLAGLDYARSLAVRLDALRRVPVEGR